MDYEKVSFTAGRVLLSIIFIVSGLGKLPHFSAIAGMMASKGIPLASFALVVTLVIEIGIGLLLLTGLKVRYAAVILALWLVPVTLTFHNFWAFQGQEQQEQMVNFLKNLAIIGGLLVVAASSRGAGKLSRGTAGGQ